MKTKRIVGMLLICVAILFTSCNKEEQVEISELDGSWELVYDDPNLQVDGSVTYSFGILQSCNITAYDVLSDQQRITQCTYVLGAGDHLITLYELGKEKYIKQYWIKKLNSSEMRWENASGDEGNPAEMNFRRRDW